VRWCERYERAGLDVFEEDPAVLGELLRIDGVMLASHIASASIEARAKTSEIAEKSLLAVLRVEMSIHLVNKESHR